MSVQRFPYSQLGGAWVLPEYSIDQYLSTNGDGTGTVDAAQNYASEATYHHIRAPGDQYYVLERMLMKIRGSNTGLSADDYANIAEVTNGVSAHVRNGADTVVLDKTAGLPVKLNADWTRLCFDSRVDDYGSGDNFIAIRWTFARGGSPLILPPNYSFGLRFNDDFSSLGAQFFLVQGRKYDV